MIQDILRDAGIATFEALAATSAERLATILADADFRAPVDPATWPEQAALAAAGRWAELSELQRRLRGGRGE